MARRSDASLVSLLLTQRLVDPPASAPALKASEYWGVRERVDDLGALLGLGAADLQQTHGFDEVLAERIVARLDAAGAFAFALDEAEQSGRRAVCPFDDDYPAVLVERLAANAPPILYAVGDLGLLRRSLLGVVGSRDVDDAAATVAQDAGRAALASDWGVVSGAAKGVDRLAMHAALDAGGVAVGVVAESLVRMTRDNELRRAITAGRLCLCTPYPPSAGFTEANAMARSKLIYALARHTLVVAAADGTGGTWAGADEALRRRFGPVLVWTGAGAGPGNGALVERGAVAIDDVARVSA